MMAGESIRRPHVPKQQHAKNDHRKPLIPNVVVFSWEIRPLTYKTHMDMLN